MNTLEIARVLSGLDRFTLETPSWGYSDTGTRFGKFWQDAAAIDVYDKFADAGQVNAFTGCCPTVAVHVLWDFRPDTRPAAGDSGRRRSVATDALCASGGADSRNTCVAGTALLFDGRAELPVGGRSDQ